MLHSVRLENFGPHELFDQEFGAGITLVLGPNGVGKSNILYGTGWTVFGTKALPPEYNQSDVIRDGEKSVSGKVVMDLLGQPHTFSRTYDGKNVQAAVSRGGEQVATGARGVEEFLAMYGVTWQAASVLFSRQRELDSFVYETPAKRKEIFESLLRVETVNDARKIANARRKDVVEPLPLILTENEPGFLEADVVTLETDILIADVLVTKLQGNLDVAETVREHALNAITESSSDEDAKSFQGHVRLTQDEIYQLNKRIDSIEPIIAAAPVLSPTQVAEYGSLISAHEAVKEHGQRDMKSALETADLLSDEKGRIIGHIESMESTLRKLKDGKCPTCGSEIEDAAAHVADVHGESLDDLLDQKDEISARRSANTRAISLLQTAMEEAEVERLELSIQLDAFNYATSLVPEAKQLNLENLKKNQELNGWEEKIRALSGPTQEQRDEFSEADANRTTVLGKIMAAKEDWRRLTTVLTETRELVILYDKAVESAAESEGKRKLLASVAKALDEFRNQVLQSALNWVSLRATQIVRMVGTLPESGPTVQLSLDKNLQFWFTSGGKDVPVYRFSGGQKAVFAICLRMALSEYFSERLGLKGFLLLDAVFDSLTDENVDATAAALQECGPQQAIIFSHFDVPSLDAHRIRL